MAQETHAWQDDELPCCRCGSWFLPELQLGEYLVLFEAEGDEIEPGIYLFEGIDGAGQQILRRRWDVADNLNREHNFSRGWFCCTCQDSLRETQG